MRSSHRLASFSLHCHNTEISRAKIQICSWHFKTTQPLGELSNDTGVTGASEKYKKLSQREHVLVRPDTYVGSVEKITDTMVV